MVRREQAVAGQLTNFTLVARDALGRGRGEGGDLFAVWIERRIGVDEVKQRFRAFTSRKKDVNIPSL